MEFKELFGNFAQVGKIEAICVRPERKTDAIERESVFATAGIGLEGDRYHTRNGSRQVTLIQFEHLSTIASFLGKPVDFKLLRRNVVVSGMNLLTLKGRQFQIGEATFEFSGECHPCSRMEEALGFGGYNAMRGMGGITAKIIESGSLRIGDFVIAK